MRKLSSLLVTILGLTTLLWFLLTFEFLSWDFRNNLWAPANLLSQGEPAYNINILFANSNAVWFPQIIGVFSPLGLLPLQLAANIWFAANIVLLFILIWWISVRATHKAPPPLTLGVFALAVFLFPPTVRLLLLGQAGVIVGAGLIAGTAAIEKHRFAFSGFLFALALAKPQLCILVLPAAAAHLLIHTRAWRSALKLAAFICLFSLALTLPLWLGNLNWGRHFFEQLARNPQWSQPSIYTQFLLNWGAWGQGVWFALYCAALGASFWLWSKIGPIQAVLWSLAFTTLVSPYVWSWDFILLLPLLLDTAARLTHPLARLTLVVFYALCFFLTVLSLSLPGATDSALWWFPLAVLMGILLSLQINKMPAIQQALP